MSKELKPCPFLSDDWCTAFDEPCIVVCGDSCKEYERIKNRYGSLEKRNEELEAENGRLREAFPKWQSGEELPELMGEMILIETITGGYRTGSFAGIHSSGAIRYNTFDGLTRTIYPANIARWAYIKALKGAGE